MARSETIGEEGVPGNVGDAGGHRTRQHLLGVDALGERDPYEEPAGGVGPCGSLGHVFGEALQHGVTTLAVHVAVLTDLAAPVVLRQVLRDREL